MAKTLKKFEDRIREAYGDVIITANAIADYEGGVLNTTLGLDIVLGGGIPRGDIVNISGVSLAGKTTLCLTIAAQAQKAGIEDIYFCDIENRLGSSLVNGISLDSSKIKVIRSTKEKILTAEDYLNILESIFTEKPGCLVFVDSTAALCPSVEAAAKFGESKRMTAVPTLLYSFFRKLKDIIAVNQSNLVCITHLQANPGGYTGPVEVGGNAITYFSSVRLRCTSSKETPDEGKKEGRLSTFKVLKSGLGSGGTEAVFPIKYGSGYDQYYDLYEIGTEYGLIEKAGSWYNFNNEKFHGKDELIAMFQGNPEVAANLEKEIRELVFGKKK